VIDQPATVERLMAKLTAALPVPGKRRESATVAFSGVRIGSGAWSFGYAG
jgi:hypothetical protein